MHLAKNNIIVPIKNSEPTLYAIMNPISGSFDLMGNDERQLLKNIKKTLLTRPQFVSYLLERGYAYRDAAAEQRAISQAYAEFQEEIKNSQVQLMLVPTYGCNLACTYCFQHGVDDRPVLITKEVVDAFFEYAKTNFSDRSQKPFITLFGGEPLVSSPAQRAIIEYIVERCASEGYELAAVTNGYDFVEYADLLSKAAIKEIQFTLDGSRTIHDSRRATANHKGTFDRVVAGIDKAVSLGMPVNLRSVVDLANIEDLVSLATFAEERGWLNLSPERFKTQIGRNYELFECYAKPQHLMTQIELWGRVAELSRQYPVLGKFHRPDFKGIRYVVETGEMPMATFDTCPAGKTEWVFDLNGEIFGCTASCGRDEYKLGSFWPEVRLNDAEISTWQQRDVTAIEKCRDCSYNVICGGGCGVVAANHNSGEILAPDCRPIRELLEIGVDYYADDLKRMAADDVVNP